MALFNFTSIVLVSCIMTGILAQCPSVVCNETVENNTCYKYEVSNAKVEISSCPHGQICGVNRMHSTLPLDFSNNPDTCGYYNQVEGQKYPGESCIDNSECYSNLCEASFCKGRGVGLPCDSSIYCDKGLACSSEYGGYCQQQVMEGEVCSTEFQCNNDCGCFNNICTRYFSVTNGAKFLNYDINVTPLLCESGYIDNNLACAPAPRNTSSPDDECFNDGDCRLEDDYGRKYDGSCGCGLNEQGKAFCRTAKGDDEFQEFKSAYINLLEINRPCHVKISFSERCLQIAETDEIKTFLRAYYIYLYRHLLIAAPTCTVDMVNPLAHDYKYINASVGEDDSSSDVSEIIVILAVIGVFSLVVIVIVVCLILFKKKPSDPEQQAEEV